MTPSEQTHLLDTKAEAPNLSVSATLHFFVGLLGVLVGAAMVSFSIPNNEQSQSTLYPSNLPLLGKKHDKHRISKVVDKGNWIEEYAVSRAVLVESSASPLETLYVSGQTAFNGTDLVGDDMASQMAAAIANVDETLSLAGMHKCDIVKLYVFVTSTEDAVDTWDQYETWLADCPVKPANTLVAIAMLFRPDALIEIDVTAVH